MRRRLLTLIVPDRALRLRFTSVWSFDVALRHWYRPVILARLSEPNILLQMVAQRGG